MEFENDVFTLLEQVQANGVIPSSVDVRDEYALDRSARRGSTTHAKNMGVTNDVVRANNRWRSEMNSATGGGRLDMIETYAALDSLLPMMLRYSKPL